MSTIKARHSLLLPHTPFSTCKLKTAAAAVEHVARHMSMAMVVDIEVTGAAAADKDGAQFSAPNARPIVQPRGPTR